MGEAGGGIWAASVSLSTMEDRMAASSAWPLAIATSLSKGRLSSVKRRGSHASMSDRVWAWPLKKTQVKASLFFKREPEAGIRSLTRLMRPFAAAQRRACESSSFGPETGLRSLTHSSRRQPP